jgi:nitrite reductase/ring-hydroxylating ferredoxin subunit
VFSVVDGEALAGPATSGQPRFEARVSSGRVEVRMPAGS